MSRSPLADQVSDPQQSYLDAWQQLAVRIQQGQSFSGRERNCCFLNTRGGRFADVSSALGLDQIDDSRAVALSDWDHDGDLDVWETNRTGPRVRFLRNNLPTKNHFLLLRLVGDPLQRCPYDAIGARVVLELRTATGGLAQQTRTLAAGDGFLSQSSKTIHFGLGADEQIERVTVRWPGGREPQSWTGLSANQQYRLVIGEPTAVALPARSAPVNLAAAPADDTGPDEANPTTARLWFSAPPRFTPQPWKSFDVRAGDAGTTSAPSPTTVAPDARPLLLVCWASWCNPCLLELQQLNEHYPQLQQQGLDILALSVDGLGKNPAAATADARDLATRMKLAFPTGLATSELVEHLDALRREAIYRQDQLPIPVSFLIDAESRLRAVYAGPAAPAQLRDDVAALAVTDPDANRARAVPFPGRWSEDLFLTHPIAIANIYREERQFEDAREYLRRHLAAEPAPPANDTTPAAAAARRRLADVHHLLGRIAIDNREPDVARESLDKAIEFYPQHLPSLLDLGDLYLSAGQPTRAREVLATAATAAPRDPRTYNKLGLVELAEDRPAEAKRQFERALTLQRQYFPAANNLAWLLATHADASVRDGRQAVKIAEQIAKQVGPRPDVLDTLAAAYAEVGDFAKAVDVADLAVRNAERGQQSGLARDIALRRAGYLAQQPFREPRANPRPE